MPSVDSADLSTRERLPGWRSRVFQSDNMTFAYYEIAADAVPLHEHHHPQEEVWNVIEGKLAVTIDGVEQVAGPGCAAVVPPDTPHSARALGGCRAIVGDYPLRDDWRRLRAPPEEARHDDPREHARPRSHLAPTIDVEVDARHRRRGETDIP